MGEHDHARIMDKWLKYVAILGPMVSGVVFGSAGYVVGYQHAREELASQGARIQLIEGWKTQQDAFNLKTVTAITRIKALIKDSQP